MVRVPDVVEPTGEVRALVLALGENEPTRLARRCGAGFL